MEKGHEDFSRTHDAKASSNRAFGWVFVGVFAIAAVWPLLSGRALRAWSLIAAAAILLVTLFAPALLALPNRLWLRVGLLLNRIVSPVVLAILFYIVVTPTGALMRLFGKNKMRQGRDSGESSYWINRDPPGPKPESLKHQF